MMPTAVTMDTRVARTPWPPLLHRLVKTVRSRALFDPRHHLLLAVSGETDSVALLRLLHRLAPQWRLTLAFAGCWRFPFAVSVWKSGADRKGLRFKRTRGRCGIGR